MPAPAQTLGPTDLGATFDRYARELLRYATQRVGESHAEDIVAQTFLAAYEQRHRFDASRGELLPWLYGICTNLLRRHRRDEIRALKALASVKPSDVDPPSGEIVDVARALASLSRSRRDVLLLHAIAGLEYAEVAAAALRAMADAAAAGQPVTVAKGQSVRSEIHAWGGACSVTACQIEPHTGQEQWYDPHEGRTVKLVEAGRDVAFTGKPGEVGIARPTREWLASLPSDPAQLLKRLRKAVGHNDTWSVDHQLWDAMGQLYAYCEIVLTPARRAALLRALSGVTGLSVRDLVIDGVALVAIRQSNKDAEAEIIFDPVTGHAVGRATVFLNDSVAISQAPGSPVLDKGVVYQATWHQTITG